MVILFLLFLFIAKCHIVGHDNDDTAISAEFDAIAKKEAEEEAQLDLYNIYDSADYIGGRVNNKTFHSLKKDKATKYNKGRVQRFTRNCVIEEPSDDCIYCFDIDEAIEWLAEHETVQA